MPSDAERACFEAGIKFGSLYHQFAGTPVSPESAASLARAMEDAIENQPYCVDVDVDVRSDRIDAELASRSADYVELTGRFLDVTMRVEYADVTVRTEMEMEDDYPLMKLVAVEE
ncbi:MAG: dihydroneopterin aldolase family protein [Haloquadratum sp.]